MFTPDIFNSHPNNKLRFTRTEKTARTQEQQSKAQKNEIHLKWDNEVGSIVNRIREQLLIFFNLKQHQISKTSMHGL